MTTQKLDQQQAQMHRLKNSCANNNNENSPVNDDKEEEMSRSALAMFRAKEEEIERKKMEVRNKVQAQLGRVEEATKRLAELREVSSTTSLRLRLSCLLLFLFPFLCGDYYGIFLII